MPFSGQELLCLSANPGLFMTSKKPGSPLDAQNTTKLRISEWAFKSSRGQTWKAENNQKSSVLLLLLVLPSQIPFHVTNQPEQALLEQDGTAGEAGRLSICASWHQDELMVSEEAWCHSHLPFVTEGGAGGFFTLQNPQQEENKLLSDAKSILLLFSLLADTQSYVQDEIPAVMSVWMYLMG